MSFQMASIFWRLALALARFSAVRLSRSARRHMLTSCFALLHMPRDFQRKPRAWHSSRAVMTSSHAVVHGPRQNRVYLASSRRWHLFVWGGDCDVPTLSLVCRCGCILGASSARGGCLGSLGHALEIDPGQRGILCLRREWGL